MTQSNEQAARSLSARDQRMNPERRTRFGGLLLIAVTICLLAPSMARAQQINAAISGTVTDENKSVVPNASVTVESSQLAVRRTTTTNDDGYFIVTNLPVGLYRVTVEAQGFANYVQENVKVDVGNTLLLTIAMSVTQITQQVDVSADVFQTINKESANIETLISGTQVT